MLTVLTVKRNLINSIYLWFESHPDAFFLILQFMHKAGELVYAEKLATAFGGLWNLYIIPY